MAKIEIACFNVEAARIAQEFGAERVELCAGMDVGGTTPSDQDIIECRGQLSIKMHVMIRPRGGDFVYSDDEYEQMKHDIQRIKKMGVDGLVFGILNDDNTVNIAQNKKLVELASPLSCTFHRAFDDVTNIELALEDVISCGFETILTSGCEPNVELGLENLKKLVEIAAGRIVIMPGGGLRSGNVEKVLRETSAQYVHSSAITSRGDMPDGVEIKNIRKEKGV